MSAIVRVLIGLSALAFVLAVIGTAFTGPILTIQPEALSRACSNMALIAIAVTLCCPPTAASESK